MSDCRPIGSRKPRAAAYVGLVRQGRQGFGPAGQGLIEAQQQRLAEAAGEGGPRQGVEVADPAQAEPPQARGHVGIEAQGLHG